MRRPLWLSMTAVLIAAVSCATAATAEQAAIQVACDTLPGDPSVVRVGFSVTNILDCCPICYFALSPKQAQPPSPSACRILACEAPPGWRCVLTPNKGGALWEVTTTDSCLFWGESISTFTFAAVPGQCCYDALYFTYGPPEPTIAEVVCFECAQAVPAKSGSWARVKAIYR
jgi:hypothetical protein